MQVEGTCQGARIPGPAQPPVHPSFSLTAPGHPHLACSAGSTATPKGRPRSLENHGIDSGP